MLQRLNVNSLDELTSKALPKAIQRKTKFQLPGDKAVKGEHEVLSDLRKIMDQNKVILRKKKSFSQKLEKINFLFVLFFFIIIILDF